jgi:hypothetical protein
MSNYFQVLKRIEQDRSNRATAAEAVAAPQREVDTFAEDTATTTAAPATVAPVAAAPAPAAPATTPVAMAPLSAAPPAAHVAPAAAASASVSPAAPATTAPATTSGSAGTTRPLRAVHSTPPSAHPAPPAPSDASARSTAPIELKPPVRRPAAPLSAEGQRGIATLFDNIRALASGRATRVLVFAGAAATDSVCAVTEGLARHAQRHGMSVFIAELTRIGSGPTLVSRMPSPPQPLTIDLDGGAAPGELNAWVSDAAGDGDLVILEAPPLADSIDAALLACACDGLVIVADTEVTPRGALQVAAERARVAGCRTLGVVMNGTKEQLPSWMRRLFGMGGDA